ncbi:MAG: esterase/lipase family protein [Candidatus Krumholzibacteriia bacterium]
MRKHATDGGTMAEVTLIIHGWSDSSHSFRRMKDFLVANRVGTVDSIQYADYESREDNITFNDVVDGLHDRMVEKGFITRDGRKLVDLNVVVHSTGGLIIRHFIWRYWHRDGDRLEECPVRRLVMLAPANFGSPLAHRGKSFFGSLIKGRKGLDDFLETGRQLLDGLELGSSYQWELAHRDLLTRRPLYSSRRIATTVLVGVEDYEGIRRFVNKPGTDGTVVIAGTALDATKLVLSFCEPRGRDVSACSWARARGPNEFAFGVLEGLNHGSIVHAVGSGEGSQIGGLLLEALRCRTPDRFRSYRRKLDGITNATYRTPGRRRYQQFLVHAVDDQDAPIRDFSLEFFVVKRSRRTADALLKSRRRGKVERELGEEAHERMTRQFHTYGSDPSYRRFLVDVGEMQQFLERAERTLGEPAVLCLRIHVPRIDAGIEYDVRRLQNIVIHDPAVTSRRSGFFRPDATTLIELRVDRTTRYVTIQTQPRRH